MEPAVTDLTTRSENASDPNPRHCAQSIAISGLFLFKMTS